MQIKIFLNRLAKLKVLVKNRRTKKMRIKIFWKHLAKLMVLMKT